MFFAFCHPSHLLFAPSSFVPAVISSMVDDRVAGADTECGRNVQVLKEYESKGFDMLLRAFNETGYLEELTGLADLHKEGEKALEAVDWDEEDGGEGDDF